MAVVFEEERTNQALLRPQKPTLTDKVAKSLGVPIGTASLLLLAGACLGFVASYFLFSHADLFKEAPSKASIEKLEASMRVVH